MFLEMEQTDRGSFLFIILVEIKTIKGVFTNQYFQYISPIAVVGVFPVKLVDGVYNSRAAVNVKMFLST
jgi:hypothetical protein